MLADREGVALIPIAHRPHRRRGRHPHLVRVDEDRGARERPHEPLEQREIRRQMRGGPGLIVDVRALVVVEGDRDHICTRVRDGFERALEPAPGIGKVRCVVQPLRGRVIGVRVLECRRGWVPTLEEVVQRHAVLGALQEPCRVSAIAPFVANDGTWAKEDLEIHRSSQA